MWKLQAIALLQVLVASVEVNGFFNRLRFPVPDWYLNGQTTTERVRERGSLRCGVNVGAPIMARVRGGVYEGFEVELCKAVAAAVLGKPRVTYVETAGPMGAIESLLKGEVDVLFSSLSASLGREAALHVKFGTTYMFEAQTLLAQKAVQWEKPSAEVTLADVQGKKLSVCVQKDTTSASGIVDALGDRGLVVLVDNLDQAKEKLTAGECDMITGNTYELISILQPHLEILPKLQLSRSSLAPASNNYDLQWSSVLQAVLHGLVLAEQYRVGQSNLLQVPLLEGDARLMFTSNMGLPLADNFMVDVLTHVGNYGDVYSAYLEPFIPRANTRNFLAERSMNTAGGMGLLQAHAWRSLEVLRALPPPAPVSELEFYARTSTYLRVTRAGTLRCGLIDPPQAQGSEFENMARPYFLDWCKAIAIIASDGGGNVATVVVGTTAQRANQDLMDNKFDVLLAVGGEDTVVGVAHTSPIWVDAIGMLVPSASDVLTFSDLMNKKVCMENSTKLLLDEHLIYLAPAEEIVVEASEIGKYLRRGQCDAVVGLRSRLSTTGRHGIETTIPISFIRLFPSSIRVRDDDISWLQMINWAVHTSVLADHYGISSINIDQLDSDLLSTEAQYLLGDYHSSWPVIFGLPVLSTRAFVAAIAKVGNIKEMLSRSLGTDVVNTPWTPEPYSTSNGGVLYPSLLLPATTLDTLILQSEDPMEWIMFTSMGCLLLSLVALRAIRIRSYRTLANAAV